MNKKELTMKEMPLLVKIMALFFILGLMWKILVVSAIFVKYNYEQKNHILSYKEGKQICTISTNNTYPNYDQEKNLCYRIDCEIGHKEDLSDCKRTFIEGDWKNDNWN